MLIKLLGGLQEISRCPRWPGSSTARSSGGSTSNKTEMYIFKCCNEINAESRLSSSQRHHEEMWNWISLLSWNPHIKHTDSLTTLQPYGSSSLIVQARWLSQFAQGMFFPVRVKKKHAFGHSWRSILDIYFVFCAGNTCMRALCPSLTCKPAAVHATRY